MSDVPVFGLESEDLDGHTLDELSDYLDAGREPADPGIENSPACQIALAALARLRVLAAGVLDDDLRTAPPVPDSWIAAALAGISLESRAGRRIPIPTGQDDVAASVTEGALRGLVRLLGDAVPGLLVGRIRFLGDPGATGEPVVLQIEANVRTGTRIPAAVTDLRSRLAAALPDHAPFVVSRVDVLIRDLEDAPARKSAS